MKTVTGVISKIGDSIITVGTSSSTTKYSFIEIGGTILLNKRALTGLTSQIESAVNSMEPVTLYLSSTFIVGISFNDGKTYSSNFQSGWIMVLTVCCLFLLPLGIVTLPLLIGFLILYLVYRVGQIIIAAGDAKRVPNAIRI